MCHKTLDKIKVYSKIWIKLNPDYEIKLYDDEMCKKFLLYEYSQHYLDVFNFLKDGPIKADFWRICILYKYGGLYVDADIEPLVPLSDYIEDDDDFVTCISTNPACQFNPHFILCNKNNELLSNAIERYVSSYEKNIPYSYWGWSICMLFTIEGVIEKKSQILYIGKQKYKFLYEQQYIKCEYNGKVVFNNRYDNYRNSDFVDE